MNQSFPFYGDKKCLDSRHHQTAKEGRKGSNPSISEGGGTGGGTLVFQKDM